MITHAVDAHEEDQLVLVLRLGQDHDRPDLGHRLGQQGRRQRHRIAGRVRQSRLIARHVLDPHDSLIRFKRRDAIHQQERIAVGEDPLDGGVVEGQLEVGHVRRNQV